jgi:hypothetical protein
MKIFGVTTNMLHFRKKLTALCSSIFLATSAASSLSQESVECTDKSSLFSYAFELFQISKEKYHQTNCSAESAISDQSYFLSLQDDTTFRQIISSENSEEPRILGKYGEELFLQLSNHDSSRQSSKIKKSEFRSER